MIFVCDITLPFSQSPEWTQIRWPWSTAETVVANLEGAIVSESDLVGRDKKGLFNHVSVLEALIAAKVRVVSLANNHIMDVPVSLANTLTTL